MEEVVIEAQNRKLGRVASEAASALRGKHQRNFAPHRLPAVQVKVVNTGQLDLDAQKLKSQTYKRYSGYPGGLREITLEQLIEKQGVAEAVRLAVWGMLPKNKLRAQMIKNLTVLE